MPMPGYTYRNSGLLRTFNESWYYKLSTVIIRIIQTHTIFFSNSFITFAMQLKVYIIRSSIYYFNYYRHDLFYWYQWMSMRVVILLKEVRSHTWHCHVKIQCNIVIMCQSVVHPTMVDIILLVRALFVNAI